MNLDALLADHDRMLDALASPAWWQQVLADPLGGAPVRSVEVGTVGTGQVASCLRIRLDHDAPDAPGSLVAKVGSSDPTSRATSQMLRHGEIEVGWYRDLAPGALVRTPRAWQAAVAPDGSDFLIVLEDLDRAEQADQIRGMSVEDAALAVDELAGLHATSWGRPPGCAWMEGRGDPATHAGLLAMLYPGFVERYAQRLGREVMGVAERLMAVAGPYLTQRPGPQALVHGDFRPDNLLVGDGAVWVVDWQTVAFGAAFGDLAYFLGGALDDADRSEHAAELLERYRARLAFHGVELSTAEVAEGWRRYALDGLVMAIGASQVVGRTDRGDDMFCAMAERSATHALVVGTLDLFD